MKDVTRRAVAFIAGCLISGEKASAIYDYSAAKYFNFSGKVSEKDISLYDHELNCNIIAGFGTVNSYSLYHYGTKKHIALEIKQANFTGYDYDSGKHFQGSVANTAINIYDYETGQYYNFSI